VPSWALVFGAVIYNVEKRWTATHSGRCVVRDDNELTLEPLGRDINHLEDGFSDVQDGPLRITAPAIRRGWLDAVRRGEVPAGSGRGVDGYVTVAWETALDLVATELARY
jgi:biotin/methionine sulfoxide reductase